MRFLILSFLVVTGLIWFLDDRLDAQVINPNQTTVTTPLTNSGSTTNPNLSITGAIYALGQSYIPICILPNATVNASGALSLSSTSPGLPGTFADLYGILPSTALSPTGTLSGAFYIQMSSATAGQVFTTQYTTGTPLIPNSPTSAIGVNSGYTQGTTEVASYELVIPANTIGSGDWLEVIPSFSYVNNSDTKSFRLRFGTAGTGGTQFAGSSGTTTVNSGGFIWGIEARGHTNSNATFPTGSSTVNGTGTAVVYSQIDTTQNQVLTITLQVGAATDYICLEGIKVILHKAV